MAMPGTDHLRFLDFPPEIRELVYRQLLLPQSNRRKDEDSYVHYKYDLSVLRVNRQIYNEALDTFHRVNQFVAIETPWPAAKEHLQVDGYIPILLADHKADEYKDYCMLARIDAPALNASADRPDRFVIHILDLQVFCDTWNYRSLSTPGLNQHLRLDLHLSRARPLPGEVEPRPLPLNIQKALIEPFGKVRDLREVHVHRATDASFERRMRDMMLAPNTPPEDCLDEAGRLKDLGNKALVEGKFKQAIELYEQSFLALHIVCDGKRRTVWADRYYQRDMLYGNHKGQVGGLVRLVLRVKLVANVVFAYLKMGNNYGYTWAHYWGMRTINLLRDNVEDEAEEPLLDFPAANELGKIYYRTGVASKQLDKKDEARSLLKVAMAYLPNDPQIKQEHASVAMKIL